MSGWAGRDAGPAGPRRCALLSGLAHDEPPGVIEAVVVVPVGHARAGGAHDTEATEAIPALFRVPRPGTSIARPQRPCRWLTTNPCR